MSEQSRGMADAVVTGFDFDSGEGGCGEAGLLTVRVRVPSIAIGLAFLHAVQQGIAGAQSAALFEAASGKGAARPGDAAQASAAGAAPAAGKRGAKVQPAGPAPASAAAQPPGQQAPAGQAPPQAWARQTERGPVQVRQDGAAFIASQDDLTGAGASEDEAIGKLLAQVEARRAAATNRAAVERTVTPARPAADAAPALAMNGAPAGGAPAGADDDFGEPGAGGTPHPKLMSASSFRQVLEYFVDDARLADKDKIVAECNRLRAAVPTLGRIAGEFGPRVERGLEVLKNERGGALHPPV